MSSFPAPPPSLSTLVGDVYQCALSSGSLIFTSSESVTDLTLHGVTYRIRFCPALLHKPQPTQAESIKSKKNPFLPPDAALLVAGGSCGGDFNLVLNKYPIIAHHFILSTVDFHYQNEPLRKEDLAAVWACLHAWRQLDETAAPGERLYAFFNSGHDSGASQPHRHAQFIPLSPDRHVFGDDVPDTDDVWSHPVVPFTHYVIRLRPETLSPERLYQAYGTLLERCRSALGVGSGEWSYNMGMTERWIMLAPRTRDNGGKEGLTINGTVLAGEMMVKRKEDLDHFSAGGLVEVLRGIGVPSPRDGKEGKL